MNQLKTGLENAGVAITSVEAAAPLTNSDIDKYEELFGINFPAEFKTFYQQQNGISIIWEKAGEVFIGGWIDIWSMERMFGGYNASLNDKPQPEKLQPYFWEEGYHEGVDLKFRRSLRMLEPHNGLDTSTAIHFDAAGNHTLFYVSMDKVVKLPFTFGEYISIVVTGAYGLDELRYHLHTGEFYDNPEECEPVVNAAPLIPLNTFSALKGRKPEVLFER